jgi:choline kinase
MRCETFKSLMEAVLMLKELKIETDLLILANCPVLPVARNTLVAMFLADPDATDLFFIDYDVKFNPEAVIKLLHRPEEVIAGAYRVKVDDRVTWAVEIKKDENGIPVGKVIGDNLALLEADYLATGFMRIKRSVFEKWQQAYPELKYTENVIKTENRNIEEAWDYFPMGIDGARGRYTTEDFAFCKFWRDIGGQLWVYPDIDFDHIGKKAYTGNFHEYLLRMPGGAKA